MNRGFFLGGTSSILRTFRAGPVKKHPVCCHIKMNLINSSQILNGHL